MKKILFILTISCVITNAFSQNLNFGLNQIQKNLPTGNAPKAITTLKEWVEKPAILTLDKDNEYIISEGWNMIEASKVVSKPILEASCNLTGWYNATVPGTVLTTLVNQGVYPDPYIGLNNMQIPETLCRMNWWYRVEFDLPDEADENEYAKLLFNGINYKAQIWFNGQLLGDMTGAFKRGDFDITHLLKEKNNVLAVQILPPNNPGIPHEANMEHFGPNGGALCLDGPTFLATEGWDWMPAMRDRSIGIWQDVRLCLGGSVSIEDPQVITDLPLPDTTRAAITIKAILHNKSTKVQNVSLSGKIGNIELTSEHTIAAGESKSVILTPEAFPQLVLDNPKLWWPNGYGNQPLYQLKLSTNKGSEKTVRFGIREMSYELMVDTPQKHGVRIDYSPTDVKNKRPLFVFDKHILRNDSNNSSVVLPQLRNGVSISNFNQLSSSNPYLFIKVNGVPIFIKGGNWGMDDAMKRVSRERLEPYFRLNAEQNFNMARNWLGHNTEEVFYDLCDEYGILVWNDFTISTEDSNLRPLDHELFLKNAEDIVKRYVNHPSIAIWGCGNETYAPRNLEEGFQSIVAKNDGTRHYHGQSRYVNLGSSGPWKYIRDFTQYYQNIAAGFNTELGAPSVPTYGTLKKFIPKEDMWPRGEVWSYHDAIINGWVGWNEYCEDIDAFGIEPCKNAEEFTQRAQVLNYNLHRIMFESWNDKMWDDVNGTSGLLYWMSHPAWYSLIQQTYSWDYKTFGTFYGIKKACESLHVQWNLLNHEVKVVNASSNAYNGLIAELELYNVSGKIQLNQSKLINIKSNEKVDVFKVDIPKAIENLTMIRLKLTNNEGGVMSINDYWTNDDYANMPKGLNNLNKTNLTIENTLIDKENNSIKVEVVNNGETIAPYVEMDLLENDESILPSYYSDSYFNLLPGEKRTIIIEVPNLNEIEGVAVVVANSLNSQAKVFVE
jgi:beta-galactosidase/beta-glucuronidase/archaellum component FlaF (FlaF/FlaG flagellin family)